jgi:hypothetical protein
MAPPAGNQVEIDTWSAITNIDADQEPLRLAGSDGTDRKQPHATPGRPADECVPVALTAYATGLAMVPSVSISYPAASQSPIPAFQRACVERA